MMVLAIAPCSVAAAATPALDCLEAAAVAERRWSLPEGLLAAIGDIETGRLDAWTGLRQPWPWSINAGGSEYVLRSADEATAVAEFLQQRGLASIDVGCFQVNLHYHPGAFGSLQQGFDPFANADYAARLLHALYAANGAWTAAIGAYHSANPAEAALYRERVLHAWIVRRQPYPPALAAPAARDAAGSSVTASEGYAIPVYTPLTLPDGLRSVLNRRSLVPAGLQRRLSRS